MREERVGERHLPMQSRCNCYSAPIGSHCCVGTTHSNAIRLVRNSNYISIASEDVFLQLAPLSFDASTFELWGALANSARLVIAAPNAAEIAALGQIIDQYKVSVLWLTAGLFHLAVEEDIEALRPVRKLLAGGDVLSVPHVRKAIEVLSDCQLINGYGPT